MQTKLHQWAKADPGRRFDDLANLVYDPAFLVVAWSRVRGNKGARTAGVDGVAPRSIVFGVEELLGGLRDDLKAGRFVPQRVREKTIPKASGKVRRLGIPTSVDRIVQASLKLVLEPIFEADFKPCSYGFRPKRRAQDAIAEIHYLGSPTRNYEWVFEADITACFDEIDHTALMGRVRDRIGDKRVLGWVKAFLRAGILTEEGLNRETITGTPQGGILSPLLANIALSVLDEHFTAKWEALGKRSTRGNRRRAGVPVMRLVRYADDFVVMVAGTRHDAEALWDEVAAVLAPMGLRLSEEKTRVCHIDEGFDFLGWRIQRRNRRGRNGKRGGLHLPVEEGAGLDRGQGAVAHPTRASSDARRPAAPVEPGAAGLVQLLPSRRVPADLQLRRLLRLLAGLRLAPQTTPRTEQAHPGSPPPSTAGRSATTASNCSGPRRSPSSATATGAPRSRPHGRARQQDRPHQRHEHVESRMRWKSHVRFGGRAGETHHAERLAGRSGPTPTRDDRGIVRRRPEDRARRPPRDVLPSARSSASRGSTSGATGGRRRASNDAPRWTRRCERRSMPRVAATGRRGCSPTSSRTGGGCRRRRWRRRWPARDCVARPPRTRAALVDPSRQGRGTGPGPGQAGLHGAGDQPQVVRRSDRGAHR